jgi:hypothetical protein
MAIEYTAATVPAVASSSIVIFSPPFFAAMPQVPHMPVARAAPNGIHAQAAGQAKPGDKTMATIKSSNAAAISAQVWRDLARLAVEALAIGVVFSVLLALAVFVVARGGRADEFAGSRMAPVEIHATAAVGWD